MTRSPLRTGPVPDSGELTIEATIWSFRIFQTEEKREVTHNVDNSM